VTLLGDVAATLEGRGIAFAVVGAGAMAVRGVIRATLDLDVLVVEPACLEPALWQGLRQAGTDVELRHADAPDPLAGVVRLRRGDAEQVDVLVGRGAWQAQLIARASLHDLGETRVPVATTPDLILLKLYAGGPQDAWDVLELLSGDEADAVTAEVDRRVTALPAEARGLWARLREEHGGRRHGT
jgi:hypothetical protein